MMKEKVMSLKILNNSFVHKTLDRHKVDRFCEKAEKGHSGSVRTQMDTATAMQGTNAARLKGKLHYSIVPSLQEKSVNRSIRTTAVENYSGRLSFGSAKTKTISNGIDKVLTAISKNKYAQKFIEMADTNMLVFDAAFALLINCTLRPFTIMSLPSKKKDHEKNKKAASKSIASGVMGFVCAQALALPLQAAMRKINANQAKYMTKNTIKHWNTEITKSKNKKEKLGKTTEKVIQRGFEMLMIPVRAGLTVALLPIVDKHIISKIYGSSDESKLDYKMSRLYLKGSEIPTDAFKRFREGTK